MQKKIFFLSIFILVLLANYNVFADMGAPYIEPYTAYVSNFNGAECYKMDYTTRDIVLNKVGTLNYNDEVYVKYEETINNVEYVSCDQGYIKATDLTTREQSANKENVKFDKKFKVKIVAQNGVEMYTGTGWGHKKIGITIPYNTDVTAYWSKISDSWVYVEYKNTTGWICILNKAVAYENDSSYYDKLYTFDVCKIYKGKDVIMEIPANTIVDKYLTCDQWSWTFYVTYNGVSGFVSKNDIATDTNNEFKRYVLSKDELTIYKTGNKSSEVVYQGKVTEEEKNHIIVSYEQYDVRAEGWYYIRFKDKEGWIYYNYNDGDDRVVSDYIAKVKNTEGAEYFEQLEDKGNFKSLGKYEYGEEIEIDYETHINNELYAVNYENKRQPQCYYIKVSDLENLNLSGEIISTKEEVKAEVDNKSNNENVKNTVKNENIPEEIVEKKQNEKVTEEIIEIKHNGIVLMCVGVAIILFFMVMVIIALYNKKKNVEK